MGTSAMQLNSARFGCYPRREADNFLSGFVFALEDSVASDWVTFHSINCPVLKSAPADLADAEFASMRD